MSVSAKFSSVGLSLSNNVTKSDYLGASFAASVMAFVATTGLLLQLFGFMVTALRGNNYVNNI